MTTPSKLDEARLRELADWFRDGDPSGEGSVLLSRSVAIEAGNDIALALDALSAERERGDRAVGLLRRWLPQGGRYDAAIDTHAFLVTQKAEGA